MNTNDPVCPHCNARLLRSGVRICPGCDTLLHPATRYAMDQINRLCGGGARAVENGSGVSILSPGCPGHVLASGDVVGGQDAMAVYDLYCRYGGNVADAMVMAEWKEV